MDNLSLIRVVDVEYIKNYEMDLTFSDGVKKRVDFLPLLKGQMFEPLRDLKQFIQFGLNHWTIEWANGADLAPEFLYEVGRTA